MEVKDEAQRFENYVALELKSRIELWNDLLVDEYDLYFIRNRDGAETDFLITRNMMPYLLCEAKLNSENIAAHHYRHSRLLKNVPFVQIIKNSPVVKNKQKGFYVVSASRFFSG